jgi:hypothetical protein
VDLWPLGEMWIVAFWNSPSSRDMGARTAREALRSWSIFFRNRQPWRVCRAPLW